MPAKSEKEAHLFGMAAAYKSGKKKLSDFPDSVRDKVKKLADSMSLEKLKDFTHVKEDGAGAAPASSDASAAPAAGAATLGTVVGRGSYEFGNNPQNGNADQRKGSGEVFGGIERELTENEKKLLKLTKKLSGEKVVEMVSYSEFRTKMINESKFKESIIQSGISSDAADAIINEATKKGHRENEKLDELLPKLKKAIDKLKFDDTDIENDGEQIAIQLYINDESYFGIYVEQKGKNFEITLTQEDEDENGGMDVKTIKTKTVPYDQVVDQCVKLVKENYSN